MKWRYIVVVIYSVVLAFLLVSVIHSGYLYQFDPDELVHGNFVFLIRHGLIPFRDFLITYLPIYHWFLTPISYITGFTFHMFEASRIVMIVLFLIRLLFMFFFTRKLFGSRVGYIAIPLYLFDPFTVFTAMQVRPDNLMMTFFIAGLYYLLCWYLEKKSYALPIAGFLLSMSCLTLIKNVPATVFIILFTLTELRRNHNLRGIGQFFFAFIIPVISISCWAWYQGILPNLIQQAVLDAKLINDTLRFPQNILNYYWPPNFILYGFDGRPVTWVYEICLPFMAFAGLFNSVLNLQEFGNKRRFVGWFTIACFVQWVSLLFIKSVFIQYFLPVSWFLAIFAAYSINSIYKKLFVGATYKQVAVIGAVIILIGGLMVSWKANNTRAMASYAAQALYYKTQWNIIPDGASVFPGSLFRKNGYPPGYGTRFVDLSPAIAKRYYSPFEYLTRSQIPFIVIDQYNFSFLDEQTQVYIKDHYQQNLQDQTIWIRRS